MSKCIVLGVKSYQFENDKQEKIEGAKISYVLENKASKSNENGHLPMQSTVSLDFLKTLNVVPGVYELEYGMVPGRNNKPQLDITGFKFLKEVNIQNLFK